MVHMKTSYNLFVMPKRKHIFGLSRLFIFACCIYWAYSNWFLVPFFLCSLAFLGEIANSFFEPLIWKKNIIKDKKKQLSNLISYISLNELSGIVTLHNEQGDVIAGNARAENTFSLSSQNRPESYISRILVTDRPLVLKALNDTFHDGRERRIRCRFLLKSPNGKNEKIEEYQRVSLHLGRHFASDEQKYCVLGQIFPIEETLSELDHVKAYSENLIQQNRIYNQHIEMTSRELSISLESIQSFAQLLATDILAFTPDQRQEYARHIQNAAQSALHICHGLEETEAYSDKIFSMEQLVQDCCHLMQDKASQKGIFLLRNIPKEPLKYICFNENDCRQTLLNMLDYGIQSSSKGDRIHIELVQTKKEKGFVNYEFSLKLHDKKSSFKKTNTLDNFFQFSEEHKAHREWRKLSLIYRRIHPHKGKLYIQHTESRWSSLIVEWGSFLCEENCSLKGQEEQHHQEGQGNFGYQLSSDLENVVMINNKFISFPNDQNKEKCIKKEGEKGIVSKVKAGKSSTMSENCLVMGLSIA